VLFREGDIVRAGQPLFRIDPRPFDTALERTRADLNLARAKETLARSKATCGSSPPAYRRTRVSSFPASCACAPA
jgi:multidrug efflux pump subunit AcrA (membrane-fusion protein)